MSDPKVLVLAEATDGTKLGVVQGERHTVVSLEAGELVAAKLTREQATDLALAILSANTPQLAALAETVEPGARRAILAALLSPDVAAELLDQATQGQRPS